MVRRLAVLLSLLSLLFSTPLRAEDKELRSLAMNGVAKYNDNFDHFDYANPSAPQGGTLHLGNMGSFDSLNPFIVRGTAPLGLNTGYLSLIYESLMARSWDEPFTLYSLLAETIIVPEDRSSITFCLNGAAKFSDDKPVTADDILFSFETLRSKGRPNHRTFYSRVEKAEKLDDRRVKFSFKPNPDGHFDQEMPLILGLMPILPKHDWLGREFDQTTWRPALGSGPYIIDTVNPGRSIIYKKNPHYWGKDVAALRGFYNFDKIIIDFYRDDGVALQAFKAGQFDWRREIDITKWVSGYEGPAVSDGRIKLETLSHHRPEPLWGFVLNTRRRPFQDPRFRAALFETFDSGWINRNIFHGLYKREESYFPNSELAAPPLPDTAELKILEPFRARLDSSIFSESAAPPSTDGSDKSLREHLLKASSMLRQAGYNLKDNQLYSPDAKPVSFEIILSDPNEEKLALTWTQALKRVGVDARVHAVDSAQYQKRITEFSYDVTIMKWYNTLSPGNEQSAYWSSASADQPGSRNYAGVKDPIVDNLARAIPAANSREELVTTTHALDRVLMHGHYVIPFFYLGADNIASWTTHLHHPTTMPLYGTVIETWWYQ